MIFSINSFSRSAVIFFILIFLSGCAPTKKSVIALVISGDSHIVRENLSIAVLPVVNLSRTKAPLKKIQQLLAGSLNEQGANIIDNEVLENFMAKHRIRYVGGIDKATAEAFSRDIEAEAVLVTSLEYYYVNYPPKIALTSRLVSTGKKPEILWVVNIGLAGDDSPKILGLGLIRDPKILLNKAVQQISRSFADYKSGKVKRLLKGKKIRSQRTNNLKRHSDAGEELKEDQINEEVNIFQPKSFYRSSVTIDKNKRYSVAVLPFYNRSEKRYAGEIMSMHFVDELEKLDNFSMIDPGIVRDALLKFRVVMIDGISLSHASLLFSRLNADLIVTGNVIDYQDYVGPVGRPLVDFSVMVIERKGRKAIWTSKSYNEGDDNVLFFDFGKINTANAMASEMVKAVVEKMVQ